MCGRYTVTTPAPVLARHFGLTDVRAALERPRYNLAPTQLAPVVANGAPHALDLYRWGLIPSWAKDAAIGNKLINARAETLADKPAFRTALKKRRCLVLADSFFEWKQGGEGPKTPYLFRRRDRAPFAFAGLWEEWTDGGTGEVVRSFTIVTTDANRLLGGYHHRMPVILPPAAYAAWLDPAPHEAAELAPLLRPAPDDWLEAVEVGRWVNAPRNDTPQCIEGLGDPVHAA